MKKTQSPSKSKATKKKMPPALAAALQLQRDLVAQQEKRGNFNTYDHTKLARLETAAARYE